MADPRIANFAKVLVEHSTRIVPGDRVLIEATTAAEPLVRELYIQIMEKGGHPHPMIGFPGMMPFSQDDMYLTYAGEAQLDFIPTFYKIAYDQFESRIRVHSATNTRGTTNIDPVRAQRRSKALSSITEAQMRRGAEGDVAFVAALSVAFHCGINDGPEGPFVDDAIRDTMMLADARAAKGLEDAVRRIAAECDPRIRARLEGLLLVLGSGAAGLAPK